MGNKARAKKVQKDGGRKRRGGGGAPTRLPNSQGICSQAITKTVKGAFYRGTQRPFSGK